MTASPCLLIEEAHGKEWAKHSDSCVPDLEVIRNDGRAKAIAELIPVPVTS